jgi:hypothetical protein
MANSHFSSVFRPHLLKYLTSPHPQRHPNSSATFHQPQNIKTSKTNETKQTTPSEPNGAVVAPSRRRRTRRSHRWQWDFGSLWTRFGVSIFHIGIAFGVFAYLELRRNILGILVSIYTWIRIVKEISDDHQ